jgi:hypothetical protein
VFVEEIANMLDLDKKGVKVVTKDNLRNMCRFVAGHYSPFTCTVSINKIVASFWVSTFAIMLHEYKHHLQRRRMFLSMTLSMAGTLGVWFYGRVINSSLLSNVSILGVIPIVLLYRYFESDARRYERKNLPDILLLLQVIEFVMIADLSSLEKAVRHNLGKLNEEIRNRTPYLSFE